MDTFKTSSLSLAAGLLSQGAKFKRVVPNGYTSEFEFSDKVFCQQIQTAYINNTLRVNLREVEENIKVLKSLLRKDGQIL